MTTSTEPAFVVRPTVYRLEWAEGHPYHGLVVRVRSLPTGTLLHLAPKLQALRELRAEDVTAARVPEILEPFQTITQFLVSWNLQEEFEGQVAPVPATFEGLLSQETALIVAVLSAWVEASGSVPAPLEQPSTPGGGEASGSTEEWLASLPNSPAPN